MAKKKVKTKKPQRQRGTNLDALLGKLDSLEKSGGLGSDQLNFWRPKPGRHTIRILPPVGDMEYFFYLVGRHYIDKKPYNCPRVTDMLGDECPICERASELLKRTSKADIAAGKDMLPRKQYWMNILVRKSGKTTDFEGPFIYTPGVTVFDDITALVRDPDYGDLVTDPMEGIDIRLEREGTGRTDTSYSLYPGRYEGPANPDYDGDEEAMWEWLEGNVSDLSQFVNIPDYDDLVQVLEGTPIEDDEEEDEREALRRASQKGPRRRVKAVKSKKKKKKKK